MKDYLQDKRMINNIPPPPVTVKDKALVSEEEFDLLLDKYLDTRHRNDPRTLRFIDEFLRSRSISQAAAYAGISETAGKSLRTKKCVADAITAITNKMNLKYGYEAEEVVERAREIMDANLADLQRDNGEFISNLKELTPSMQRAIKKIKVKNEYELDPNGMPMYVKATVIEYELWDKMKSLDLLGAEKNVFKKTTVVQHDVTQNMAETLLHSARLAESREVVAIGYKEVTDEPSK